MIPINIHKLSHPISVNAIFFVLMNFYLSLLKHVLKVKSLQATTIHIQNFKSFCGKIGSKSYCILRALKYNGGSEFIILKFSVTLTWFFIRFFCLVKACQPEHHNSRGIYSFPTRQLAWEFCRRSTIIIHMSHWLRHHGHQPHQILELLQVWNQVNQKRLCTGIITWCYFYSFVINRWEVIASIHEASSRADGICFCRKDSNRFTVSLR